MPDVLRLGLVGPLPPPNGGMAMQTLQLARLLGEEGMTVEIVQTNAPYRPRAVEQLRGLRAVFRLVPYLWRIWSLAGRVDVIHLMANSGWSWQLFSAPVVWLGWLRGTPVVVNYRGGEAREYLSKSMRWVRPTLNRASAVVVPSGFLQAVFREFGVAVQVVPNIVDLELFQPPVERASSAHFSIVIARNLEALYGIDTALQAFAIARARHAGLRLMIAGSGPQRAELEHLAQRLDIADSVTFLGRLDRPAIVALYHAADAMLNPSRVDNMPNSVLEALACGVPVVSTNVGGVPYIVREGETALLVEMDQPEAMATAMLRLAGDEELRSALIQRGVETVAQYGWDSVRPLWLETYRRVVGYT
tara:strand:+ start:890 stop:1972 length:1083 start_codon:yes stop_codon:yes gene_type:complete